MDSSSKILAKFVTETAYEQLPENVVNETKRIILDSVSCALSGKNCDRGIYAIEYAGRQGGHSESSIIGASKKVSCASAAFANGELMNAIDYDAFEIPPGHFPPFVVPPSLALAESKGASGKALIHAVAIGSEIGSRIGAGLIPQKGMIDDDPRVTVLTSGQSFFIFGGVTAAGILLKLNVEKLTHAMGIAGHFCPVPNNRKFQITAPSPMTRLTGWVSQATVTAALLAQMGYLGDLNLFDGPFGFWRMYAYDAWHPERVMQGIGEKWIFLNVGYKLFPCHRALNTALDGFIDIIEENHLVPEDIKRIKVFCNPSVMAQPASQLLTNHVDAQSNIAYNFACAAHRIRPEKWQFRDTMENPDILKFMEKVSAEAPADWKERISDNPATRWSGGVEVYAKNDTFKQEGMYPKGTAWSDVAMTDAELVNKFKQSASEILPQEKIDRAATAFFELETLPDVNQLAALLTP